MINKDSIVSAFNSKGTLLKWLKLINEQLDKGQLQNVTVANVTATTFALSFNFANGTSIVSSPLPIFKGDKGEKGDKGNKGEDGKGFFCIHSERMQFDIGTNHYTLEVTTLSSTSTPFTKSTFDEYENTIMLAKFPIIIYWSNDDGISATFTATSIETTGDTIPLEPTIQYIDIEGKPATFDFSDTLNITYTDEVTNL